MLGPKSSALPDEPGAGDSTGLEERLEKYAESHLPCVVTACQGCMGQAGEMGGLRH